MKSYWQNAYEDQESFERDCLYSEADGLWEGPGEYEFCEDSHTESVYCYKVEQV